MSKHKGSSKLLGALHARPGLAARPVWPQVILWTVLVVALVLAVADLPSRWSEVERIFPVVQQWANPEEQYRIESADLPSP